MKILITGSSGFIGKQLCNLVRNNVCVIRRGEQHQFNDFFEVISINQDTDWSGAFVGIDAVIHLAGLAHSKSFTEDEYKSVNVEGTLNLARSAIKSGVKRFIFVSSIGVNGQLTRGLPFTSDSIPDPNSYYACSKLDAEIGLKLIAKETGLEVVIIRPTLVYGPNAPGNFGMLTKLIEKLPLLPFGLTNNKRSFISVDNLVDLIQECATNSNAAGHTFLASEGRPVSTKEFTNALACGLGKKVLQLPIPPFFFKLSLSLMGKGAMYDQLFASLEVDSSDLKEILNWSPPYSMEQSMAKLSSVSSIK